MSNKRRRMDKSSNCHKEIKFKKNCDLNCCDNLIVKDSDIYEAECVPVVTEKIFDSITLEDFKYRVENEEFTIVSTDRCHYDEGAPICIDKIGVTYDFIGIGEEKKEELVNSESVIFSAEPGTGYNIYDEVLYNEYVGTFVTNRCCEKDKKKQGIKSRVLENNVKFYVSNLQIVLIGTIGNKPFKAISSNAPYTGTIFDGVSLDFYGRMTLPKGYKKATIHEEYEGCLTAECATTNYSYSNDSETFTAAIEFLLVVEKTMYSTVTEKMAVFTMSNAVISHSGEVNHVCYNGCPEDSRYDYSEEDSRYDYSKEDSRYDCSKEDSRYECSKEDSRYECSKEDSSYDYSKEDSRYECSEEDSSKCSSEISDESNCKDEIDKREDCCRD